MRGSWQRTAVVAVLSITGVLGGMVAAAPAQAQTGQSGSVSFGGDPGDYITGGRSYSYSTGDGDAVTTTGSDDNSHVSINISGANGDWWYLDFDAPGSDPLAPGTYDQATRYPFNDAGPGLSLDGNGRGCNELTGTFTVQDAVFGPDGYVQTFDATFEQHCEGDSPAARGEVHIGNPAPPAPLDLKLAVATDGTASSVSGNAVVHGTVDCNQATPVTLSGTVTQVVKKVIVRGTFSTTVNCTPDSPASWSAKAVPTGSTPFKKGQAEVNTHATGHDSEYDRTVSVDDTTVVTLTKV